MNDHSPMFEILCFQAQKYKTATSSGVFMAFPIT